MSTTQIGHLAEAAAASYLEDKGYSVIARNVRSRWSELDIVAERHGEIIFVEVKFRSRGDYGGALAAITPEKARRLQRAAAAWAAANSYTETYSIGVVAISGNPESWQIDWLPNAITG